MWQCVRRRWGTLQPRAVARTAGIVRPPAPKTTTFGFLRLVGVRPAVVKARSPKCVAARPLSGGGAPKVFGPVAPTYAISADDWINWVFHSSLRIS